MTSKYDFAPFNLDKPEARTVLVKDNKCVVRVDYGAGRGEIPFLTAWYCGYVALPKDSIPMEWLDNYDAADEHVNVHGGLTYSDIQGDYAIFGFDCAHAGDDKRVKLHIPENILAMAEDMEAQLVKAATEIVGGSR